MLDNVIRLFFLRILPVLILSRFAVHKGPDEQDEAADERYEAEEHVPAAFADVVQAPDGHAEVRDKHDEVEDCHHDIGCRRVFSESKAQYQEKHSNQTIDKCKRPILPSASPAAEVCKSRQTDVIVVHNESFIVSSFPGLRGGYLNTESVGPKLIRIEVLAKPDTK